MAWAGALKSGGESAMGCSVASRLVLDKKDLVKINGFNQEMQYGGQDRELGERLENLGIKGKQIRYSAICVHLDHARGYVNPETWAKNNAIRKNTRDQKLTWTEQGITTNL